MARTFSYVRPDEMPSLSATVTTTVGATEADYTDDWLVDGRSGRPARATSGTVTWSCAFTSAEVGCIAVCNHNIDAARTISITGGFTTSLVGPALPADGIPLNPVIYPAATTIAVLAVGVAGNTAAVIIGEFVFGKLRTCIAVRYGSDYDELPHDGNPPRGISVQPFDEGLDGRTFSGVQLYTTAELAELIAWRKSQRGGSKPSLLIPDVSVQDAWLGELKPLRYRQVASGVWEVTFTFVEYPRVRW